MFKYLINNFRDRRFAKSQAYLFDKQGTLYNSFIHTNTIFIHIPKTAGLSLINAVYGNVEGGGHRTYNFYSHILGDEINSYFKFCFVRNPINRLYSAYNFLSQGGLNKDDQYTFNNFLAKYDNFENFVINGLSRKLINKVIHFKPQTYFICDYKGNVMVDFIGKYENLSKDIDKLSKILNKEFVLPILNVSNSNFDNIEFDKDVINKIRVVYQQDFNILGY